MAEQASSRADRRPVSEDDFAISEHAFTEKLNAESSSETRERLEDMGEVASQGGAAWTGGGQKARRIIGDIETFTRRQPLEALLCAIVVGVVLGLLVRR
jgi:ElaB/YqjD/DUF883 family membrane-anchored ribosome-binding protein